VPVTTNTVGQMYALTVFTPIVPDRLDELRAYLASLPRESSPLARLGGTHFARWVVVPDFISDPSQPREEHLPSPYLLFSATLDGELDAYLDELCSELAEEAQAIWGCCLGAPTPASGAALKAYLKHNQIDTGLFFAAYPEATVDQVRGALDVRARTIALAVRGQSMEPAELQQAFLEEFGS
jgi:hypothetical protein